MSTPKQRRLRRREKPADQDGFARFQPVLLDEDFDADQAEQEFARWRWPERDG